jgi:uncharacterized protein YjbI with pentapeptide repeats
MLSDTYDGLTISGMNFDGLDLASLGLGRRFVRFDHCTFVGADLRQSTLDRASFKLCDFRKASFRGASARGTRFVACDLRDADVRDVDLTGGHLGTVLTGGPNGRTDVTGAQLSGIRSVGLVVDDEVIGWPGG